MSSVLKSSFDSLFSPPYEFAASSFIVLILQVSQKLISRFEILVALPLHVGQIMNSLFDFMCSTSVLHFMS